MCALCMRKSKQEQYQWARFEVSSLWRHEVNCTTSDRRCNGCKKVWDHVASYQTFTLFEFLAHYFQQITTYVEWKVLGDVRRLFGCRVLSFLMASVPVYRQPLRILMKFSPVNDQDSQKVWYKRALVIIVATGCTGGRSIHSLFLANVDVMHNKL